MGIQSFNSKYDKYVRHEPGGELNEQELHGLALFRRHCVSCHQEPLFTNNGLPPDSLFGGGLKRGGSLYLSNDSNSSFVRQVQQLGVTSQRL